MIAAGATAGFSDLIAGKPVPETNPSMVDVLRSGCTMVAEKFTHAYEHHWAKQEALKEVPQEHISGKDAMDHTLAQVDGNNLSGVPNRARQLYTVSKAAESTSAQLALQLGYAATHNQLTEALLNYAKSYQSNFLTRLHAYPSLTPQEQEKAAAIDTAKASKPLLEQASSYATLLQDITTFFAQEQRYTARYKHLRSVRDHPDTPQEHRALLKEFCKELKDAGENKEKATNVEQKIGLMAHYATHVQNAQTRLQEPPLPSRTIRQEK
jgi:hypothetical protein